MSGGRGVSGGRGGVGGDVPAAFDDAAPAYDRLVGASPGYHTQLRLSARRLALPKRGAGLRLLDLGCGTGASTAALLAAYPEARIEAVDGSAGMLEIARTKNWPDGVTFRLGRVEELAAEDEEKRYDAAFAAYLLRNVSDARATLRTIRSALRPSAPLVIHDYCLTGSPVARAVWDAVCWGVIVPSGKLLTGDARLYRYLWRSVLDFPRVGGVAELLRETGFVDVRTGAVPGWQRGVVHTLRAEAPRSPVSEEPSESSESSVAPAYDGRPSRARDRRAVHHPAPAAASTTTRPTGAPRTVVVGGGIAGLAAAVALAERGIEVELVEREATLGGRVRGWSTTLADGSPATMSRGFHAFFPQYYNLHALLRRVDPGLRRLVRLPDYPLLSSDGRVDGFAGLPRTPPLNALAFVARSPTFGWRDLPRLNAVAARPLADVRVPEIYERLDRRDASGFLDDLGFPASARHLAFEVFSRSFFARPEELSAAELAMMFHLYFLGSDEGLLFDVPNAGYDEALWNPLGELLRNLGGRVRLGAGAERIDAGAERRFAVRTRPAASGRADGPERSDRIEADAVVLAADVRGLREVVGRSPVLADAAWRARIERLRTAPPFLVSRLWLGRPVDADRPAFLGTAGFGPLDNVSVLDRYEDEAARWARSSGGSVVELHAYALDPDVDLDTAAKRLRAELHRVYPETREAPVVDERNELREDCPSFAPGTFADRPTVATPDPRVVVAGDLVRVDLPVALMERAATSGFLAANELLRGWGLPGHAIDTVPVRGRSRVLCALAGTHR